MPMNAIQFQRGMPLPEFRAQFGSDAHLEHARWPDGFRCPRCGHPEYTPPVRGRQRLYQCRACCHQASLRAGTVFAASKLPLTPWFLAIYLMTQSKNNVGALELKRTLGVAYRTACLIKRKLMRVMSKREAGRVLRGRVEPDDAYLGGVHAGKRGRGAAGKVPLLIVGQTQGDFEAGAICPDYVRLDPVPDFTNQTLTACSEHALDPETLLVSDGLAAFLAVGAQVAHHERVVGRHPQELRARLFSLFRTPSSATSRARSKGPNHGLAFANFARRSLGGTQYRFNRRFDMAAMVPRLVTICVVAMPITEKQLRMVGIPRCSPNQTVIMSPEIMAYLKVRPDRLDDTETQLANDDLVGGSP
jgi:transposase-like protein